MSRVPELLCTLWSTDSLEKTLMLGSIEGRRRRGWDSWMASPTQWTWVWASSGNWWWTGKPGVLQSRGGHKESDMTEWLNYFSHTHTHIYIYIYIYENICNSFYELSHICYSFPVSVLFPIIYKAVLLHIKDINHI